VADLPAFPHHTPLLLVLGFVPVIGDLLDAYWKSNDINIKLLYDHILKHHAKGH
jgi:hypothetical protein